MLVIVVALHCEAKPIIEDLSLKRTPARGKFEQFASTSTTLIISGIGKIRSAIATSLALSQVEDLNRCAILNFGICAAPNIFALGQSLLINKVIDNSSSKSYHPDILVRHPFKELSISTYDSPQNVESLRLIPNYAIDMEASGFFDAASIFLPPSQIQVIKVVSDHFNIDRLSKDFVSNLIKPSIEPTISYMRSIKTLLTGDQTTLSVHESELIKRLVKHLNFTTYQSFEISKLALGHKIRSKSDLSLLESFLNVTINSKADSKNKYEEIRSALSPS